jgi:hypothetical protein
MALIETHFQNGLFYTYAESHLTRYDIEQWIHDLHACAAIHGSPIVAIFDISRVTKIASAAHIAIADITRTNLLGAVVFVASGHSSTHAVKTIAIMSERNKVHIFDTLKEARLCAEVCLNNLYSRTA